MAQIANILVDQNDRIDAIGARIDALDKNLSGRIDALDKNLSGCIDELGATLGSRLDRLIAVTIQERTYSVERLADIERRLTKLEDHVGI